MLPMTQVIKYEGDNSTFIWKHPREDFNSLSQLIVHESQEAIFMMNGQALDLFGPGRYTLESQNIPLLSKTISKVTDGDTPFHCEVYFINKTVQMALKWGTQSRVRYLDPNLGFPVDIGAFGRMNMMVCDSRKLLVKLVGTMNGIAWENPTDKYGDFKGSDERYERDERDESEKRFTQSIQESFRPMISAAVKSHLVATIKEQKINLFEIDAHLAELSDGLLKNIRPILEEYGLTVPQFFIESIALPQPKENADFDRARELHSFSFQAKYAQARAEAEAAARAAQIRAETTVGTAQAESDATIAAARRQVEIEKQLTATEMAKHAADRVRIEAQAEAQAEADKIRLSGVAEVEVERMRGLAEAEIMAAKGYTQRDVLQADVQKAYAEGIGQMGSNGGGSGMVSDVVGLGAGMAMAGSVGAQMNEMFRGMTNATNSAAAPMENAPVGTVCRNCGKPVPAQAKFCLECGTKVEAIPAPGTVICPVCGKNAGAGKFCMECGAPLARKCPKCGLELMPGAKFCPECGEKL